MWTSKIGGKPQHRSDDLKVASVGAWSPFVGDVAALGHAGRGCPVASRLIGEPRPASERGGAERDF